MLDPADPPRYPENEPPAERLRDLFEHVPAVIYEAEAEGEGRWLYVSPQLEELLGYQPAEWLAEPGLYESCIHPDDRESVARAERKEVELAKGAASTYITEYRMVHKEGRVIWIRDEARLATDVVPPTWRGVLVDVTDAHEASEALEKAHAQAVALAEAYEQDAGAGAAGPASGELEITREQVRRLLDGIREQVEVLAGGRGGSSPGRVVTPLVEDEPTEE
jgi:PAS domain S-box-containing protein